MINHIFPSPTKDGAPNGIRTHTGGILSPLSAARWTTGAYYLDL